MLARGRGGEWAPHDLPLDSLGVGIVGWGVLYHLVPRTLVGSRLLPLNALRGERPALFERYARKYEGREGLLEDRVPDLVCRWGDVVFLTAVPPRVIRALHEEAGFDVPTLRWFEIDPARLERERLQVYWYRHVERERKFEADNWSRFALELLPRLREVPDATRRPFAFFGTPHVLYRGSITIQALRVVEA